MNLFFTCTNSRLANKTHEFILNSNQEKLHTFLNRRGYEQEKLLYIQHRWISYFYVSCNDTNSITNILSRLKDEFYKHQDIYINIEYIEHSQKYAICNELCKNLKQHHTVCIRDKIKNKSYIGRIFNVIQSQNITDEVGNKCDGLPSKHAFHKMKTLFHNNKNIQIYFHENHFIIEQIIDKCYPTVLFLGQYSNQKERNTSAILCAVFKYFSRNNKCNLISMINITDDKIDYTIPKNISSMISLNTTTTESSCIHVCCSNQFMNQKFYQLSKKTGIPLEIEYISPQEGKNADICIPFGKMYHVSTLLVEFIHDLCR